MPRNSRSPPSAASAAAIRAPSPSCCACMLPSPSSIEGRARHQRVHERLPTRDASRQCCDGFIMMTATDVIEFYRACRDQGIAIWIDGGWAVDALLQAQTRFHNDLDIAVQQKDLPILHELLAGRGYADVPRDDASSWNFVLGDSAGHEIDVHVIVLDAEGNGLHGPRERGEMYPAASLAGEGTIMGQHVRCISAEWIVKFKMPYIENEKNRRDIEALKAKFGV